MPGETALALAPLAIDESVGLFDARARQAKRDFVLTETERPHVEALVRQLDGLPLAIELAAARVRVMPPATILERLGQRFKLLSSSGGRHTRHATLRATLDWSWELLSADEQAALAQVSVFEGGFTLAAAEAVLSLDALWPMDAVQALVDKSLVRQVADDRFDLLVSVQEYASEQLEASGVRAAAEARHGAFFAADGTEEAIDALDAHGGHTLRLSRFADLDNQVAACRRAVARGDGPVAVNTLCAAWAVLNLLGPFAVGARLASDVLGPALAPEDRARAGCTSGDALARLGQQTEALAHFEAALAAAREAGDRRLEGVMLSYLGFCKQLLGQTKEATAHQEAALAIARRLGERRLEGRALGNLGSLHLAQDRLGEARVAITEGERILREVGDRSSLARVLCHRVRLEAAEGQADASRTVLSEAEALVTGLGAGPDSPLGRELAKARAAVESL